ncbi:MAG: 3-hydroxyacyl-CoA dehydrogenase NAD-binding domain-containing protein [Terracidiphilus sp.]
MVFLSFLLKTIAIIGAGPLGRWLAQAAARAGFGVYLEDVMPANLRNAREEMAGLAAAVFHPFVRHGGRKDGAPIFVSVPGETGGEIAFVSTIEDAVREADLAIDCVPDELESKLEIFCLLDRMAPPRTVLMTPTPRLSIADLAACTYRADKCVAIAAEAASLVESAGRKLEIRTTAKTAPETVELVRSFWERLGIAARFERDPAE